MADDEKNKTVVEDRRIRYADEETAPTDQPMLRRVLSNTSQLSIHSVRSRRFSIDPATAVPIQYRTL